MNAVIINLDRPCFYKKHFGFECPGCGIQRAWHLLIEGQFFASLKMYPALIPLLLMVLLLLFHLTFKFSWGAKALKFLFITNIILIATNYLIKLLL